MTMQVINTYHVGYPDLNKRGVGFLAVLVRCETGVKVYSGIVALPDVSDRTYTAARERAAEEIASKGMPESLARARTFYPGIDAAEYRS